MIEVFENLLSGHQNREEVIEWSAGFSKEQVSKDIYWDFKVLKVLTLKGESEGSQENFFIRRRDTQEYLLGLKQIDYELVDTPCQPIRIHQLSGRFDKPCVFFKVTDSSVLEQLGIKLVRGIYDIPCLMEYGFFMFDGMEMSLMRGLDPGENYGMTEVVLPINAKTKLAEAKLIEFLSLLALESMQLWFTSEEVKVRYVQRSGECQE